MSGSRLVWPVFEEYEIRVRTYPHTYLHVERTKRKFKKVAIAYVDDMVYQDSRLIVQSTRSLRAQIARSAPHLVAIRPLAHPSVGG